MNHRIRDDGRSILRRPQAAVRAWVHLVLAAGTGLFALCAVLLGLAVAVLSLIGLGLLLVRPWLALVRSIADLERARLRRLGHPMTPPYDPLPRGWRRAVEAVREDRATRRDLGWLVLHGTGGLVLAVIGVQSGTAMVTDLTSPLWARLLPRGEATVLLGLVQVDVGQGWIIALAAGLLAGIVFFVLTPLLDRATQETGLRLLSPHPDVDLSTRITQLTATRAAALDAHAVELRRIERALHDGAQNRLVGVAMLTGAARESVRQDPEMAEAMMERAHGAAEDALAELRGVVRSILPPVLADRGLQGALSALAAACAVPCTCEVEVAVRCPVSVESTAYFVAAEALTNVSRHSDASRAALEVRRTGDRLRVSVRDDGRGGARPGSSSGTGLAGIARRVAALDGTVQIDSPLGGPTLLEVELPCGS